MYGATRLAKQRRLSVAHQMMHLKKVCPSGRGYFNRSRGLVWRYDTRPTPISRNYKIRIEYQLNAPPSIFIETPNLHDLVDDNEIPHLYSQERQKLCLYKPRKGEWFSEMLLAQTILPWVELWLFYFEEWLLSGEWKGGGEHPE